MKNSFYTRKSFWVSQGVCLLPILLSLIFYDQMPEKVATHFDVNFVPDGYSPKWQAAFMIPGILFFLNIFVWFMLDNDPRKAGINPIMRRISQWIIPVLSVTVQSAIIFYSIADNVNLVRMIPLMVGVMLMLIGNYMPKCRQNYTAGIRLPWTLSSEENWNRTHRFGGKAMVAGGILLALCSFIKVNLAVVLLIVLIFTAVPVIYSYILYKKGI